MVRTHIGRWAFLLLLGLLLAACNTVQPELDEQLEATKLSAAQSRYVIVFNGNNMPRNAQNLVRAAGGELVKTLPQVGVAVATSSDPRFAARMGGTRGVRAVDVEGFHELPEIEVRQEVSAEVVLPALWDLQWNIRRVKADEAWERTTGSHETVVAVIDTGIAWNHPDLAPNVVYTACYATTPTCSEYPDLHWHGTHVAGTVAANFGGGVVGVGPNLGLASYNVFELFEINGEFALLAASSSVWAAMLDAAKEGFDVANMSLGAPRDKRDSEQNANRIAYNRVAQYVTRQGVTLVSSAGNSGRNFNGPIDAVPASLPSVIAVSATGIRPEPQYPQPGAYDVLAFYSDHGAYVNIAAPGGDCGLDDSCDPAERPDNWFEYLVLSTDVFPDPGCAATASCPIGWAFAGGTSMAAPHVAGVAGLVKNVNPSLNPQQVRSVLQRSAERIGHRQLFGHGMVDAYEAVRLAAR